MKTLKDIAVAIAALPVEAFKGTYGSSREINEAVRQGYERWNKSAERVEHDRQEDERVKGRQVRDAEASARREANVIVWLNDGTLVKGTFIKVLGARDGYGIREFIEVQSGRLACRQWMPMHLSRHALIVDPDKLRAKGFIKIADMWLIPQAQMTTHEFNKVAKILN
jgi:hypothetical protein